MLFQESALFDSLTVAENVGYKLFEETDMTAEQVRSRVVEVLGFIGLEEYIDRMPSELSGGQRRRVAIARAIAARPHLLLFDDPTSGLDPLTAKSVDAEIIKLRDLEHVTPIVVTHQMTDAFYIATHQAEQHENRLVIGPADPRKRDEARFIMLRDAEIYFEGDADQLRAAADPVRDDVPVRVGAGASLKDTASTVALRRWREKFRQTRKISLRRSTPFSHIDRNGPKCVVTGCLPGWSAD